MQRNVAITRGNECVSFPGGQVTIANDDIGTIAPRVTQALELGHIMMVMAVYRFDQQLGTFSGRKRLLERFNESERILSFDNAKEVKHEEEKISVGKMQ